MKNPLSLVMALDRKDWPKFFRYAGMMFIILFIYTILRDMKDVLVITAPGSGAEVITFLKCYIVVPFALLSVMLYSKVIDVLGKYNTFYFFMALFTAFFCLFCYVVFPMQGSLHMDTTTIHTLKAAYPRWQWVIALVGNWSFSLFYVFSELWGNIMLSLLFWWYVNNNTSFEESKKFYPVMALIAQLALICSGLMLRYVNQVYHHDIHTVIQIVGLSVFIGVALLAVIYRVSLQNDAAATIVDKKKSKPKTGVLQGIKYLFESKYLLYVCIIVISYGVAINLTEVTWKSFLKMQYTTPTEYGAFMGAYSAIVGATSFFIMLIASQLLQNFSWRLCALITPVMLSVTGLVFLMTANFELTDIALGAAAGTIAFLVGLGLVQNVLSKSTKYSLFDPTKEMTYLPLTDDEKTKGKAAIEVVGSRLGKSGGALFQNVLLMVTAGTQLTILPYISFAFATIAVLWIFAIFKINQGMKAYQVG